MDEQYNQQTNGNPNQPGNFSGQGNPYPQNNPYQQGNPYQQNNPYQQGNPYQQNIPYQQPNPYPNNGYGNYNAAPGYAADPEPQKAPNIFEQFGLAFMPPKYGRLTKVKTASMILFVTLLALLSSVILFGSLALDIASIDIEELVSHLPDFEISDGHFYIEENFLYDEEGIFVYLTEEVEGFSYDDASQLADEGYQDILLVGRDSLSLMQNNEYQQLDFGDLGNDMDINRDWIVDTLMPFVTSLFFVGYIIFFLGRILWYFLCAAVYLLFGLVIASILHKQVSTGALFKTAVYAKVLMFVVATLFSAIPFVSFSVPFTLRVIITVVFMGFAIAKLPDQQPYHYDVR
ncbi:MAG: DUF1189 family protein [Lachnospiraceae bacterium]|nr:DUF1189 family protein [Lachnospiraceae bacterium]